MTPTILFRHDRDTLEEMEIAQKFFPVTGSRVGLDERLVIGRYSVLPYYKELEFDLKEQCSRLINNLQEHRYIASFEYYEDVKEFTPETWFRLQDVPDDSGPYVLKGLTNSRKFRWNTHMYAADWTDAGKIHSELMQDPLIGEQGVLIRKFEKLKILEVGINGMPMANEWRFFFYRDQLLTNGFYWTISEKQGEMNNAGMEFAYRMADILKERTNFFVIDIAEKESGEWILIEVNDGQMSGLSGNDPHRLYAGLKKAICD